MQSCPGVVITLLGIGSPNNQYGIGESESAQEGLHFKISGNNETLVAQARTLADK